MGYPDQKYHTRRLEMVADSNIATTTYTVSGANTLTAAVPFPVFNRRSKVTAVKVVTKTAAVVGSTGPNKLNFLRGTDTFAIATVGTGTAGSEVVVAVTSLNTFTASQGPTVTVTGTATASAGTIGAYEIFFEVTELFDV